MAKLSNLEENVVVKLCLKNVAEEKGNEYETWINCELKIETTAINCMMGQNNDFTLNKYELLNFVKHVEEILHSIKSKKEYSFDFSNYEYNFEIRMEHILVDGVIEIEIWINWGNYTLGEEAGYDIGVRCVTDERNLQCFLNSLNEEMNHMFVVN